MRPISRFVATVLAIPLILAACQDSAGIPPREPLFVRDDPRNLQELARLEGEVNRYRRSLGKNPIQRHPGLDRLAQLHCEFMAMNPGKFELGSDIITHYGFEERSLRAQRQYGLLSLAENVAGGPYSSSMASRFARAWIASPGHDFNLRHDWDATGFGVHITPSGTAYATQLFGTRSGSHFQMTDRMRSF